MSTSERLPSLLVQAARSAAEADGLAPPPVDNELDPPDDAANDNKLSAAEVLTGLTNGSSTDKSPTLSAMERARTAIAAAQQAKSGLLAGGANPSTSVPKPSAGGGGGSKKKGPQLRRGKWTAEEEAYANRLIQEFKAGLLPLTDGTTLRTFLSKLLNCDPMRISKKFVGSNCIGKQVFRRRTADINRLTAEQIQQSRTELSELERRFLERVAQTNRVKTSGVGNGAPTPPITEKIEEEEDNTPPSPPWMKPPLGYTHGQGASLAAANLSGGGANRSAAAAGRALLQGIGSNELKAALERKSSLDSRRSAGLLALAGFGGGSDSQNLLNALSGHGSASNLFAASASSGNNSGLSSAAMAQIARNASAARLAGLTAAGSSMSNLLLKSGMSRDQLSQLAREGGVSSASLSNMMDRQSSFDALMSLDLQSLQSIDNLANLIQSGGSHPGQTPQSGLKNWSAGDSSTNLSGGSFSNLLSVRHLASVGRMQSLLHSLSNQNVNKSSSGGSNANFSNLLQSLGGSSSGNFLSSSGKNDDNSNGNTNNFASALSLANLLRAESGTGLSALRAQDGLTQRNSSVDDFLSLVAAGDIPHEDPSLLNIPLMHQQQQQNPGSYQSGAQAAATLLAQQQLLAQLSGSNSALASALERIGSFGNLNNNFSAASLLAGSGGSAASLINARAAALSGVGGSSSALKRKLMEMEGLIQSQRSSKK